jgi:hypothetical protein
MAAHAMTMVHTADRGYRTTPLAHSPAFYIEVCVKTAIAAGMENALLAAIGGARKIFAQVSADTDSQSAEAMALDFLFRIAVPSYPRQAIASCFQSVEMMLLAAQRDIQVRGFREVGTVLSSALERIVALMPLEVEMGKAGKRVMQTFPPYNMSFQAYISVLLDEVARQVKPVDPERSWIDPYHDFMGASVVVVTHYRNVAEHVLFESGQLHHWIVETIFKCVEVYLSLIDNPPEGAAVFLETVEGGLRSFIYVHAHFFQEKKGFPYNHSRDACGNLAVLGMILIQRQRLELAEVCGEVINAIARGAAAAENQNGYRAFGFADCMVKLEELARAADALGHAPLATSCRARCSRPPDISEQDWPEYAEAIVNRTRHMERELAERGREIEFRRNSCAPTARITSGGRFHTGSCR